MPVADYKATVDGVRALLPHRDLNETTKPSVTDVEGYIKQLSAWVNMRVGTLDAASAAFALGKGLVELGAAAWAEDAAFPERASKAESRYGDVLWQRFLAGVDEVLEALGKPTDSAGAEVAVVSPSDPLYSFPPPLFERDRA